MQAEQLTQMARRAAAAACLVLVAVPLWLPGPARASRIVLAPVDNSSTPAPSPKPTPSSSPPTTPSVTGSKPSASRTAGSAPLAARVQPRTPSPPAICITPGRRSVPVYSAGRPDTACCMTNPLQWQMTGFLPHANSMHGYPLLPLPACRPPSFLPTNTCAPPLLPASPAPHPQTASATACGPPPAPWLTQAPARAWRSATPARST